MRHHQARSEPRRRAGVPARAALAASSLLLILTACGSDDNANEASVPSASPSPASAVETTPAVGTEPTTSLAATTDTVAVTDTVAAGTTTGITADSITVSVTAGFTGAFGDAFKAWAADGYGLWADEVNAGGGINGRKIELKMVDNLDTAEGGVAACKEIESNGSFMAISMAGFGGADTSLVDCLDAAGIPVVALNLAGFDKEWTSVISAYDAGKQAVPLASFIQSVIDPAAKVGLVVTNDPVHLSGKEALLPELERLGVEVVGDETVALGQASFVAELTRLQSAGATTVAMITATESMGIVRDGASIGFTPAWTGLYWTIDDLSQVAADLWKDIQGIRGFPTADSDAFAKYSATAAEFKHETVVNTTVMGFYGNGLLVGAILDAAGPDLTREAVPGAAEQLGDYDNGIYHLSFAPGVRNPDIAMFPVQCCSADKNWTGTGQAQVDFG